MKYTYIILSLFILLIQSCQCQDNSNRLQKTNSQVLEEDYSFIADYAVKNLPFVDSTNFDNHRADKLLSKQQIKLLKLDKVFSNGYLEYDQSKIGINYILNLSENYTTIVIFFYFSDTELSSTLINYD